MVLVSRSPSMQDGNDEEPPVGRPSGPEELSLPQSPGDTQQRKVSVGIEETPEEPVDGPSAPSGAPSTQLEVEQNPSVTVPDQKIPEAGTSSPVPMAQPTTPPPDPDSEASRQTSEAESGSDEKEPLSAVSEASGPVDSQVEGRNDTYESLEAQMSKESQGGSRASRGAKADDSARSGRASVSPTPRSRSADSPPKIITTTSTSPPMLSLGASASRKPATALRRGKWTVEEEAYVARVIQDFNSGFLDAPAGTTLRTYLSEKLQCDPMRITKKFTGDACIGKRVFHPAVRSPSNSASIDKAQAELDNLERRWRRRLEMQQRESAKKAAASAAAAAAATGRPSGSLTDGAGQPVLGGQNVVTRTASWLDRAKSVLQDPTEEPKDSAGEDLPKDELMHQMQEVQRLIHEGPVIKQTSAGIPLLLDQAEQRPHSPASSTEPEPADKRMKTGAEDAEALVGFLRSVRAAAGQDF